MSDIKTEALGAGIDLSWVTQILSQWGEKALEIVTTLVKYGFDPAFLVKVLQGGGAVLLQMILDAVQNGLSKDWVVRFFTAFGPAILQFILDVYTKMTTKGFAAADSAIANSIVIDLLKKWLPTIVKDYVPPVLIQHNQEVSDMIIDVLTNFIKNQPNPTV